MSNLPEQTAWESGIHQLEEEDRAKAGPGGVLNIQATQLANRTRWLRDAVNGIQTGETPYPSVASANAAISRGDIPLEALFSVRSVNSGRWVDEYKNIEGTAIATGKSLPAFNILSPIVPSTSDDPTGTSLGLSITSHGQYFGVYINDDSLSHQAIRYYLNQEGKAIYVKTLADAAGFTLGNLMGWQQSKTNPFTSFFSINPNQLVITSDETTVVTYRSVVAELAKNIPDGGTLKATFLYNGPVTNPNLYLRLMSSDGTTWVSQEIAIKPSAYLQTLDIPVSGGFATYLYCYVRGTTALSANLWLVAHTDKNNSVTDFLLRIINNELDFGLGDANNWTTSLFDTFVLNGVNSIQYATATAKYASGVAPVNIAAGESLDIYYRLTESTGNAPVVKLTNSAGDASAIASILPSGEVGKLTLTATADATGLLFYVANTVASAGTLWIVAMKSTPTKSADQAVKQMVESVSSISPFAENALPVANAGMNVSFTPTSNNSWTFAANGTAYASVAVRFQTQPAGAKLKFLYRISSTAGATYARLQSGSAFVDDVETLLTTDGKVHELELQTLSGAQADRILIYSRTGSAYSGYAAVSLVSADGEFFSATSAMNDLLGVLSLDPPPYVESSRPIANAVMQVLNVTSNNSFEFGSDGSGYASVTTSFPPQADGATLRFMYNIKSDAANLYIRLQAGSAWAGVETRLITDGTTRYVELPTTVGLKANRAVIYARIQAAYTGTAFVALVTANGIYVSSVAAANALASGGSEDVDQDTDVIFPSSFYLAANRRVTLYGDNAVAGERKWRGAANVMISSTPASGKPAMLRNALPEATFMPDEIGGTTLDVNARSDGGNVFRKSAEVTIATPVSGESISVCALMDSHGSICVPWLAAALNGTGAIYSGVGMYSVNGIKYEGRAGWATFSYMGRRSEDLPNPFLKTADATDKATYPQWCYADDFSGVSYAENPGLSGYNIFDPTAWAADRGLTSASKLVFVIQLGVNDRWRGYAAADVAAAQDFMISQFKKVLPDARFIVSSHALGWTSAQEWITYTPYIKEKLKMFDGRESEKILQAPTWMFQSGKYGWRETAVGTSDTGVVEVALSDDVHPTDLGAAQFGDANVGPIIAAWGL
ncbi:TPA: SGNH/GDSL hydrolase family protein [Klebsiella pneumoniae]